MGVLSEVVSDYIFFHFIHPRDYFTATPGPQPGTALLVVTFILPSPPHT